jgi:signal transduction histidine kinase
VKRIDVQLQEESGEIQLTVSDLGKGFDVSAAMQDLTSVESGRQRQLP